MTVHSFHLAEAGVSRVLGALRNPPTSRRIAGLRHAEIMAPMQLGTPVLSPKRWRAGRMAMFAAWEDESALEQFLATTRLGVRLAEGWHVRLEFLRRWGEIPEFGDLPTEAAETNLDAPVVAVTLARAKLLEVPRFIRWGKPVERLVRDHPDQTLALAAFRLPRTFATFSIWKSARAMLGMVHGGSAVPAPERHAVAMAERNRRRFHHAFTTLRFRCLSEHGEWDGRSGLVPTTG